LHRRALDVVLAFEESAAFHALTYDASPHFNANAESIGTDLIKRVRDLIVLAINALVLV
jgi:hypothetical protein